MEEELKLLGLNDIDIKIYLILLKLGESSASEIANKAGIPRASVYDILERLAKEGLVSYNLRDFKKYFSVADPKTIVENLEYKTKKIKDILPELEKSKGLMPSSPKSEVYEGIKGLQTILNMMLLEKEFFIIGASGKSREVLPFFIERWHKERIKRKIKVKIIYNDTIEIRAYLKKSKDSLGIGKGWNYKFLKMEHHSPLMTLVFGDNVALIMWRKDNPSAILIQNKDIADTYKQYILKLWGIAKK